MRSGPHVPGYRCISRYCPVPVSFTCCGLAPPLSEKLKVAVRVPVAVGANLMLTAQLEFASRSGGQVFNEMTKSFGFVPAIETLLMCSDVLAWFVSVTDCGPLVVPTVREANVSAAGETVTMVPVPVKATVCGLAPPLSVKLRVADSVPTMEGRNCNDTVQLVFPAIVLPHVFAAIKKSSALVPPTAMEEIAKLAEPWFVRVTVFDPLVVFTS